MERGQDQVAGERCFDADFSGLKVPDFTDHNDIGVLPQKRFERRRKGQADVRLNEHLVNAHEIELDGVFRRGDIDVRSVQRLESGI